MALKILQKTKRSTLRVYARGDAMVCDHELLDHPTLPRRGFIGRVFDPELADETSSGGWRPRTEPHELPVRPEYITHLKDGDLWPADKETADLAKVPFDPNFGGEVDEVKEFLKSRAADKALRAGEKNAEQAKAAQEAARIPVLPKPVTPVPPTTTPPAPSAPKEG
ncbi:MAG TPA: hypothetical protein VGI39_39035 [Polyangiaceae bacterium]|jgi:hypothetical protein